MACGAACWAAAGRAIVTTAALTRMSRPTDILRKNSASRFSPLRDSAKITTNKHTDYGGKNQTRRIQHISMPKYAKQASKVPFLAVLPIQCFETPQAKGNQ